jgi:hypothetical protein
MKIKQTNSVALSSQTNYTLAKINEESNLKITAIKWPNSSTDTPSTSLSELFPGIYGHVALSESWDISEKHVTSLLFVS